MMFQMEMTCYMFRSAEYRLSIQQSLSRALPPSDPPSPAAPLDQIRGQITVKLPAGGEVKVDADSYVAELTREVSRLRSELVAIQQERVEEKGRDLLAYIQGMEQQDLARLTSTISPDVLQAMQLLVDSVMFGISGGRAAIGKVGPDTVAQLNSAALAQLCMWQLVVGYNLRELETREQLKEHMSKE
mmetsp:Transcript_6133/g.19735  ORF Transcript_6133/g.19735 Transcript_6133/m.19735 type:complete len:187 (-) Transcript_6133:200-760(-)